MRRTFSIVLCLGLAAAGVAAASPKIVHSPPVPQAGSDLIIRAKMSAAGGVLEPSVYFRKPGGDYTRVALLPKSDDHFEARIPAALLSGADYLEYYIAAFAGKDLSEGFWKKKDQPYRLSLKPPKLQIIHLSTTPPSAIVDIDGVTMGPSPYSAPLAPGAHRVSARLTGYAKLDFEFTMPKDKDLELPLALQAEHQPAAPVPTEPVAAAEPVKPAPREVEPVAEPPAPAPPQVQPAPMPAKATQGPTPVVAMATPAGKGHVKVVTVPPGANIEIDGQPRGMTPLEVDLDPNSYLLSAKLADHQQETRVLKVVAGKTVEQHITLRARVQIH